MKKLFLYTILVCLIPLKTFAQKSEHIVAVSLMPPMVMQNGTTNTFTGFDIELWQAIANEADINFKFKKVEFHEILKMVENGEADFGIAGITIKEEREKMGIDFSHSYFDSGLSILVRDEREASFYVAIRSLCNPEILKLFGVFICIILIAAHLQWFTERGKDNFNDKYIPGIFEAIYFSLVTASTVGYGDYTAARWFGRIVAIIQIFICIALFGIVFGQISSTFTVEKLKTDIQSEQDLNGKVIVTAQGTTSVAKLDNLGAITIQVDAIEKAYDMLKADKIDAIVFDTPTIMHLAQKHREVVIVGKQFDLQDYGIAMKENSPYREKVNRALLKLQENGFYKNLYDKYFSY